MEPGMIRPWQESNAAPRWEAGWRKTMNGYSKCLHGINLDPGVEEEIRALTTRIAAYG